MTEPPAVSVESVKTFEKVAVTDRAAVMLTTQATEASLHAPLHALKMAPLPACAVSVTEAPLAKSAAHVAGHVIAAGALVTAPGAEPLTETVSENVGAGVIVNVAAPDVPPAGPGLKTVTWTTAPEARSAAGMSTASCPPLSNRVVRLEPFQRTTDETTKLLPVTVRIAPPALPASTRLGNSAPRDGTGLLIVKACPAEVPPPGAELSTVTVTVPPSRRSPAAT